LGTLPRPTDWTDLLKPEYRDMVAMPDPNYSGGALATLSALAKRYGFDFFVKLKANGMHVERSNPLLLQKLAQGEYAAALMVDFNVRQEIGNGAPLQIVSPKAGAIVIPTPIGVLTQAKDADTAEAFVRFLLTGPAQAIFAERGYAPVVAGTAPAGAPVARTQTLPAPNLPLAEKADLLRRFNELFGLSE
jgi:iron(III) transport system substrate-binding protein